MVLAHARKQVVHYLVVKRPTRVCHPDVLVAVIHRALYLQHRPLDRPLLISPILLKLVHFVVEELCLVRYVRHLEVHGQPVPRHKLDHQEESPELARAHPKNPHWQVVAPEHP